ncbi:carbohydrate ABC transporter permease [Lachnoclostridium sp. Marseille-P6806]|uniref:carbohydrate ABC transporter permease n=1 Tax=Lachnoclostridium sp. Marseille-P6806 TaxID=2364793 RepID=UPI00102F433A|nr:sugar ABC transporter permease [Lachnoclostridium sp. Marseille-P6806]
MRGREKKNLRFAYAVNLPLILYLACVLVFPMIWGFCISFTNKTVGGTAKFIGITNYIRLIGDPEYRRSIFNTIEFTALSIFFKMIFGMLMALALNQNFRGRNLCRALLMIPWTLPNIVVVYNWRWIFNASGGIANHLLKSAGLISRDLVWFGSAGLAMFCIVVANVWRGTPFFGISILAKMQTIPPDYYEAAEIDGAGIFQRFWHITFPEVRDVAILSALMSTIWTINEFETVWLLTGGGPNGSTEVMNVYSYKTAMKSMMLGRGIAVSILAMPVLMLLIRVLTGRMLPDENE